MVSIPRNSNVTLSFTITRAYDVNGNALSDLTGVRFRMQAKDSVSGTVLFTKDTTDSSIVVSGMEVRVKIAPADTATLEPYSVILADLLAIDSGGNRYTVETGEQPLRLLILPDITSP